MGSGCCGETGAYGIVLIIIACLVNGAFGVACIVAGVIMFLLKKDYGQAVRIIYLIGLIIAGVLILCCAIICIIAFSISPEGRDAAIACFTIAFFVELILFIILFVAFFISWKKGDYWNVNLVAVFLIPVGMAFCVLGVLILLIERESLGRTALTIIIIICIILSFIFFLCMVAAVIFLILNNLKNDKSMLVWVVIILLIVGAVIDLVGVILAACVAAKTVVGAVGFILCGCVTGTLLLVSLFYWFFNARTSSSVAYKWSIFAVGCACAFFLAVALIGLLCVGGLWILNLDAGL